jgi:Putative adhesin
MTATRAERGLALLVGGGLAAIFVLWGALHVAGWTLGTAAHTDHRVIHGPVSLLRIHSHGAGDVVVEAAPGPDATVDSVARGAFRSPRLHVDVNGSSVSVRGGCGPVLFDRCQASVTVRVPSGTTVDVSSDSGDVTASGLTGLARLTTSSGDVSASELSGPAVLHTASGDIQVHDLSGATASLEASSGDVAGEDLSSGTVRARTGSGDVDLVFATPPDRADAEAGSGDVNLLVPRSAFYSVDAATSSGDRVISVPTARHATHVLSARAGSGDVTVLAGS